ncbi:MAG TPA: hypothetical protein VNN80_24720, partial [Polyangiaceae bacterium]|nr:hypothetical protein [Polyangiaceae bacterium]
AGRAMATSGGKVLAFMAKGLSIDSQRCPRPCRTRSVTGQNGGSASVSHMEWSDWAKVRLRVFLIAGPRLRWPRPEPFVARAGRRTRVFHFEGVCVVAGCANEARQ